MKIRNTLVGIVLGCFALACGPQDNSKTDSNNNSDGSYSSYDGGSDNLAPVVIIETYCPELSDVCAPSPQRIRIDLSKTYSPKCIKGSCEDTNYKLNECIVNSSDGYSSTVGCLFQDTCGDVAMYVSPSLRGTNVSITVNCCTKNNLCTANNKDIKIE